MSPSVTASSPHLVDVDTHPLKQNPPSFHGDPTSHSEDLVLAPPPTAFTAIPTRYSPEPAGDPSGPSSNRDSSSHQRTLTSSFLDKLPPLISRASSVSVQSSRSPIKTPSSTQSRTPSITGSSASSSRPLSDRRQSKAHPIFGDWFSGNSAPISVGILPSPTKEVPPSPTRSYEADIEGEEPEPLYMSGMATNPAFTSRTPARPAVARNITSQSTASAATSKITSWFKGSASSDNASRPPQRPASYGVAAPDPRVRLDTEALLFPAGSPPDILSPHSFNDLLSAAEKALKDLHSAYIEKDKAWRHVSQDHEALQEEAEEAETRARHLKVQLEGMAARLQSREQELETERRRRQDLERRMMAEGRRKRSIRLVNPPVGVDSRESSGGMTGSAGSVSDSGFESDADAESVGSDPSRSPLMPLPWTSNQQSHIDRASLSSRPSFEVPPPRPATTVRLRGGPQRQGQRHEIGGLSSPWVMLAEAREENMALRGRVQDLENAVEGALDLVSGLG
ncbi:hypothetical protein LTS18_002697 [Coniosporium uncinatum]|uniref:Uncharacterized protein n=1 Tax=Coniosporium uncinatum TaxID=93489 RepID=A0ACC3DCM5_9PEZI|nr:hypothetical protein LTS18_002697 [Coniosporium uncinatum]